MTREARLILEDRQRWRQARGWYRSVEDQIERLIDGRADGLSVPAVMTLIELADGALPQKTLRARLIFSQPGMTDTLDVLERRGLVQRQQPPIGDDRRTRVIKLTADGYRMARELIP